MELQPIPNPFQARLMACRECGHRVRGPVGSVCDLCLCRIEKKAKEGGCPIGRF